jgi:peptidoglycan/LPS O-acetylase OafA/YrhL
VVLDSLRGVCALMVALFHFNAYSIFKQVTFFRNAYLFVDFFFVLSGFVIAANYQSRLASGFGVRKFMLLRFGRLYPLYFFVLVCFLIVEALFAQPLAFAPPQKSLDTVLANIFLLQSFGIFSFDTWNKPGWTIAVEFWTCLLFGAVGSLWPRMTVLILAGLSLISLYFIASNTTTGIDVRFDFGMLRCIVGFSTGVTVFAIWKKINTFQIDERLAFVIETLIVLLIVVFVSAVAQTNYSLFAPLVFAVVILVFSYERGPISFFLKHQIFVLLGIMSYSIYLVHMFIQKMMFLAVSKIEIISGQQLIIQVPHEGKLIQVFGLNLTQGNLWACVYIILVVGVAALTYRYIEVPSRQWFRRQAQVERP